MIVIVDYGMGNLASIANMLKKAGVAAVITSDPQMIMDADKLILPGVGAFEAGMKNLNARKLVGPINRAVLDRKVPVIGLCLGMQLMTARSEEGKSEGLGWFDADTIRFRIGAEAGLKVPHMGWNTMRFERPSPLCADLGDDARFYFVHSYHVACRDQADVVGTTTYGYEFPSAVARGHIYGVQFHPEKSHRFGLQLLTNFARMTTAVAA